MKPKRKAVKLVEINVAKRGKEYRVDFWIGNQGFDLAYGGTKAEATWMKRMLEKAFANYRESITFPISKGNKNK